MVKWYSIEEAVILNQQEPRKIFIDVYTEWCKWCKVMDQKTFSNPVIANYLNTKYYPVKLDGEYKKDITIGGTTYKFVPQGRNGYHELAATLLQGKMSYPSSVFLNEKIQVLTVQAGFNGPDVFDQIVKFFGEDYYLNKSWEEFIAEYSSPIKSE